MPYNSTKRLYWGMNTESDLAGYIAYWGTATRTYGFRSTSIGLVTCSTGAPTTVLSGLQNGTTYYAAITAFDASGNESTFSGEVTMTPTAKTLTVMRQIK